MAYRKMARRLCACDHLVIGLSLVRLLLLLLLHLVLVMAVSLGSAVAGRTSLFLVNSLLLSAHRVIKLHEV